MTTKTMRRLRGKKNPLRGFTGRIGQPVETDAEPVNSKEDDVPGFPPIRRETIPLFTTPQIAWLIRGGERTHSDGTKTQRRPMSDQAARNWLTGHHAKGWIDNEQLRHFWPGDV